MEVPMVSSNAERMGNTLRTVRELKSRSLKAVADPAKVSAAYLLKLEKGQVESPSPHILYRLAKVLDIDYLEVMREAGYITSEPSTSSGGVLAQALSGEELTGEELRAVATFLKMYRSGKA